MNEIITLNNKQFVNKELQRATDQMYKIAGQIRKCAFNTAAIMQYVDASECFKEDGFDSVHDWAMKTFGFQKTASYTLLKIGREYVKEIKNAAGKITGYRSNLTLEDADDFTTSQIEKMLPAGHSLAVDMVLDGEITTDMTCKEIEKIIKKKMNGDVEETAEEETAEEETAEEETVEETVHVTDDEGNEYNVPRSILEQYKI